jgi:hypothetical protein
MVCLTAAPFAGTSANGTSSERFALAVWPCVVLYCRMVSPRESQQNRLLLYHLRVTGLYCMCLKPIHLQSFCITLTRHPSPIDCSRPPCVSPSLGFFSIMNCTCLRGVHKMGDGWGYSKYSFDSFLFLMGCSGPCHPSEHPMQSLAITRSGYRSFTTSSSVHVQYRTFPRTLFPSATSCGDLVAVEASPSQRLQR